MPTCPTASFVFYIIFCRSVQVTDAGLIGRRSGNEYLIQDDREILEFYAAYRENSNAALAHAVMSNVEFWGQDLTRIPGFEQAIVHYLDEIQKDGTYAVMKSLI